MTQYIRNSRQGFFFLDIQKIISSLIYKVPGSRIAKMILKRITKWGKLVYPILRHCRTTVWGIGKGTDSRSTEKNTGPQNAPIHICLFLKKAQKQFHEGTVEILSNGAGPNG